MKARVSVTAAGVSEHEARSRGKVKMRGTAGVPAAAFASVPFTAGFCRVKSCQLSSSHCLQQRPQRTPSEELMVKDLDGLGSRDCGQPLLLGQHALEKCTARCFKTAPLLISHFIYGFHIILHSWVEKQAAHADLPKGAEATSQVLRYS